VRNYARKIINYRKTGYKGISTTLLPAITHSILRFST
jgi:hypothetical protein